MTTLKDKKAKHDEIVEEFILPWLKSVFGEKNVELMSRTQGRKIDRRRRPNIVIKNQETDDVTVFVRGSIEKRHSRLYLEIWESTAQDKQPGWMRYGNFTTLIYYMAYPKDPDRFDLYVIDFKKLCDWYWQPEIWEQSPAYRAEPMSPYKPGSSFGSKIPIKDISEALPGKLDFMKAIVSRGGDQVEKLHRYLTKEQKQPSLFGKETTAP